MLGLLLLCTVCSYAQPNLSNELSGNAKLRVANGQNIGMVIGLIDSSGVNYYSYGVKSLQTDDAIDEQTVFEIGSISKVFTGILLADQVRKGAMNLNDPIDLHLPDGIKSPTFSGVPIQLVHLSNHTSGLPRLPANFAPADLTNPYADYSQTQLYDFLSSYELTREAGSQYEYSNFGAGLLGHLLATKNDVGYEALMQEILAKPLGLEDTKIALSTGMEKNMATGHNMGYEVGNWDLPTLAGAGAIRSTASDLVKFLQFNMGLEAHDLYEAMRLSQQNSRTDGGLPAVGLGWHRAGANADIIWHNGGTGGFRSFIGFVESEKRGVVILTNSSASVDDLGFRILQPDAPLNALRPSIAAKVREVIDEKGTASGIAAYWECKEKETDKYDFGASELHRLGNMYQVMHETEKAIAVLKLNIEVYPNSSGSYSSLGEANLRGNNKEAAIDNFKKALSISPANKHAQQKLEELGVDVRNIIEAAAIAPEVLSSYVGKYELSPGFTLTVSKDGNQLNAQATGQQTFPIYPKSSNVFYFKVVEAQLTFNTGAEGMIESVTLAQGGREIVGKRM